MEWDRWIDEEEENIRLLDFGQTFTQGAEPERTAQPRDLRAPETIFTDRFDYRLDLWRVGFAVSIHACGPSEIYPVVKLTHVLQIYFFVFGTMPFQLFFGGDSDLVAEMINFVEDLPAEWEQKYRGICLKAGQEPVQGKRLFIVLI